MMTCLDPMTSWRCVIWTFRLDFSETLHDWMICELMMDGRIMFLKFDFHWKFFKMFYLLSAHGYNRLGTGTSSGSYCLSCYRLG